MYNYEFFKRCSKIFILRTKDIIGEFYGIFSFLGCGAVLGGGRSLPPSPKMTSLWGTQVLGFKLKKLNNLYLLK